MTWPRHSLPTAKHTDTLQCGYKHALPARHNAPCDHACLWALLHWISSLAQQGPSKGLIDRFTMHNNCAPAHGNPRVAVRLHACRGPAAVCSQLQVWGYYCSMHGYNLHWRGSGPSSCARATVCSSAGSLVLSRSRYLCMYLCMYTLVSDTVRVIHGCTQELMGQRLRVAAPHGRLPPASADLRPVEAAAAMQQGWQLNHAY